VLVLLLMCSELQCVVLHVHAGRSASLTSCLCSTCRCANLCVMTTSSSTLTQHIDRLANRVGHAVLRLVVLVAVAAGVSALGNVMGVQLGEVVAAPTAPVEQQAPATCEVASTGGLFNPCATLDTSTVDDLRTDDLDSECMRQGGVLLDDGRCVAAGLVWLDEIDAVTEDALRDMGFGRMIGEQNADGVDALLVPAEMLVLGGPGGEQLVSVDLDAALTPILLG
jgi:hypothetical protein